MNRLIVFTVALVFVLNVVVSQSETTDEVTDETTNDTTDSSENVVSSAVNAGEELYSTANEIAKAQEEELEEAIGDMTTYFSKTITDMSNILEDIKTVSESNTDAIRNNLVDNLMNYAEDTDTMQQQISRVMRLRAQFQDSILKQLYTLPISAEDAEKLESDLREQMKLRAESLPNIQDMMNLPQVPQMPHMPQMPQMPQMPKMPQQVSNFIPFNQN